MVRKIIGGLFVVVACGGFGHAFADQKKIEIGYFRSLIRSIELMKCELRYRMTPLSQLCKISGGCDKDLIGQWFCRLGELLEQKEVPDIDGCTKEVMMLVPQYHPHIADALILLCQSLGRFDLHGQLEGLDAVLDRCKTELGHLTEEIDQKKRTIQTLGVCAGIALAILML